MLGNIFNYPHTAVSSAEDCWVDGGASLFRPRLVRTTAVMLQPLVPAIEAYLLLSSSLSSVLWVFILQYCLGLIVEDIIVWKIEMQALTFCGNDNETRLIVLKP